MSRYRGSDGRRNSLRAVGYDYSWPGTYFVTICVGDRMPRFGDIVDGMMCLNDAGRMIAEHWRALPESFPSMEVDAFVVMPNHLHGVLHVNTNHDNGVDSLSRVIQAFKSKTTLAYGKGVRDRDWPPFDRRLWQRSFHDHIIRDERDLDRIRAYIADNPARWFDDREYHAWLEASAR